MKSIIASGILAIVLTACSPVNSNKVQRLSDGSNPWQTGHDPLTIQLIPEKGNNALIKNGSASFVHVKFQVKLYGEVSVPINSKSRAGQEALRADLSQNKFIHLTYRANQPFIIQLRQTGVHGGVHNHIDMPASVRDTTVAVPFASFIGGVRPLDLADVAKFNFAFLSNNEKDGFAELVVRDFSIE